MESHAGPVAATDRILSLDILRGWAVFGMLIVNMGYFSSQPLQRPEGADAVAAVLVQLLASGKFWTLFSILFGYGFALQMSRASARGDLFLPVYLRRLSVLFVIGLAHTLLHPFEIVHRYALLGFLLIPLRASSVRTLVVVGVVSLLLPIAVPGRSTAPSDAAAAVALYTEGSLLEVVAYNLQRFVAGAVDVRVLAPLPYFLLGFMFGRHRILEELSQHIGTIRRTRWWALGFGLGLQAAPLLMTLASSETGRRVMGALVSMLMGVGSGLLGLFYASVIVLWAERRSGARALRPFAAVGRMALTNYLLQTVLVTSVLYGYGLGWYGRVGVMAGLPLAAGIYAAQVVLSNWWMRRFRFGPVEWVWRSLAYGRPQPLLL